MNPDPTAAVVSNLRFLQPVGLEELNSEAALQTRVDRKYVVPVRLALQLLATFGADVRVLEMDGSRSFAYDSVYFDTAGLDSYLLAARGRRRRYKIRTRTYVDSAVSFLEVKTEGAREATSRNASRTCPRTAPGSPPKAWNTSAKHSPQPWDQCPQAASDRSWKPATTGPRCTSRSPGAVPPSTRA
jgi:hypothetical protein